MEDFEKIYNRLNNDEDSELHIAWKEANRERQIIKGILIPIFIFVDFLILLRIIKMKIFEMVILVFPIYINVFFVAILIVLLSMSKKRRRLNELYKSVVIKVLINNFYNNVEYLPNQQMPEHIYKRLGYEYYDRYKSEDYIKAKIDNKYNFEMAEIVTEEETTYTNSKGETKTGTITKFDGLFSKLEIDKSINSQLKIVANGKIFLNKNRLKMDSSEFEEYFDVQASNNIIGMQILTADIMEELVDFERETKIKYDIYIKNNEIYLRFHTGPMFEVKIKNGDAVNKELTYKYFNILKFTYSINKKIIDVINNVQI